MTVTCRNCSARVAIPDELVQIGGFLVQCSECKSPVAIDPEEIAQAEGFEVSLSAAADVLRTPGRGGDPDGFDQPDTLSPIFDEFRQGPAPAPDAHREEPRSSARSVSALLPLREPDATVRLSPAALSDLAAHEPTSTPEAPSASLAFAADEATVRLAADGLAASVSGPVSATSVIEMPGQRSGEAIPPRSPATPSAAVRQRFRIRNGDGNESVRSSLELIRLIRDGRLRREHEISQEGSGLWMRAEAMAEIERYFELREQAATAATARARSLPSCVNHSASSSAWRCGSCGEYFCPDCVKVQRIGGTRTVPCPFCSRLCQPVEPAKPRVFHWRDLPRLLRFPLVGWGPICWVAYALLAWMAPFSGRVGGPILVFFLLVYAMLVVRESAAGRPELPTWPRVAVWSSLAARGVPVLGAVLLAIAPLALVLNFCLPDAPPAAAPGLAAGSSRAGHQEAPAGSRFSSAPAHARVLWTAPVPPSTLERIRRAGAGDALLLLAGFLASAIYLPMAFLAACLRTPARRGIDPRTVVLAIRTVPREYGAVAALCLLLTLAGIILVQPFETMPVLGSAGAGMIGTYFLFIQLHALGRMAKQCEQKLSWRSPPASGKGADH